MLNFNSVRGRVIININPNDLLNRNVKTETYRTPYYAFAPLLDYRPQWFFGSGFDPSAGDGRMIAEIIRRGNRNTHYLNDIREEDLPRMRERLAGEKVKITLGDYLTDPEPPQADFLITNPPFTLAQKFVQKAQTHINGPICILQSLAFLGTAKRAKWLKGAGLSYVLNLTKRPKWEVDVGSVVHTNIWDFAWYVFLPFQDGRMPQVDWLD